MRGTYQEIENEINNVLLENQGLMIGKPIFIKEKIYYPHTNTYLIAGAFFTTKPTYIFAIINSNEDLGEYFYSDTFNHDKIMFKICGSVIECFTASLFRQKRRIILDFGLILVSLMKKIDNSFNITYNNEEFICEIQFTQHEVLVDVDWIEERMDEWYRCQRISSYAMVPFY